MKILLTGAAGFVPAVRFAHLTCSRRKLASSETGGDTK